MKSVNTGAATSNVEVLNVSPHGFWLLAADHEYFLGYEQFPWFRTATVGQLFRVELHHSQHLYWPELDVDLDLERIAHPENYPLVAQSAVLSETPGTGGKTREQSDSDGPPAQD